MCVVAPWHDRGGGWEGHWPPLQSAGTPLAGPTSCWPPEKQTGLKLKMVVSNWVKDQRWKNIHVQSVVLKPERSSARACSAISWLQSMSTGERFHLCFFFPSKAQVWSHCPAEQWHWFKWLQKSLSIMHSNWIEVKSVALLRRNSNLLCQKEDIPHLFHYVKFQAVKTIGK